MPPPPSSAPSPSRPALLARAPVDRSRRERGHRVVRQACSSRDAVAFVHAGVGTEPTLRYLVGLDDPAAPCAVVVDETRVVCCLASPDPLRDRWGESASTSAALDVRLVDDPARAAAGVVAERATSGTVLTPAALPHDAALYLENAGFDLASSTAAASVRATKTDAERRTLRRLGEATGAALSRARALLAAADADSDGRLVVPRAALDARAETGDGTSREAGTPGVDDEAAGGDEAVRGDEAASTDRSALADERGSESDHTAEAADTVDVEADTTDSNTDDTDDTVDADHRRLTTGLLRRELATSLATHGVAAAETRVWSDGDGGDLRVGRPVVFDCRPRSRDGLRCRGVHTVVVDGDGGWQRRAHVALDAALRAARDRVAVGESVGGVEAELRAELTAYGFDESTTAAHGVGLAPYEAPTGSDEIPAGTALVVGGRVADDDGGVLAGCQTVLVESGGVTGVVDGPGRLTVERR